jgi:hypothetical protein
MQTPTPEVIEHHLYDLVNGPSCDRLKPEFQNVSAGRDRDLETMNEDLREAYRWWSQGRHASRVLYHLENVTEICNERLSPEYLDKFISSLVYFQGMLFVCTEMVDKVGRRYHTWGTVYTVGQTVASILDDLLSVSWDPSNLAYGVKRVEHETHEWRIRPTQLRWAHKKPWCVDITMEELFDDVRLKPNERYYLMYSRLDLNTKHPIPPDEQFEDDPTADVTGSVYWVTDLYIRLHDTN